jgi:flavin-dependent dehydrogenase
LIVGAGPAGSAAAIWCAKFGLHVTMIESASFPRDKAGESLHPGTEQLFKQLGVIDQINSAGFLRHVGVLVRWGGEPKIVSFGKDNKNGLWLGYQAWRSELDKILLSQARELGVDILQPCKAQDIVLMSNRVAGVKTSSGYLRAQFVIDAGGGIHWLARRLKLLIERYSPPLFVYYGYVKGECIKKFNVPMIVAQPSGWLWMARVREQIYQWTLLSLKKRSILDYWVPDEFKGLVPIQPTRGEDATWRRVVQPAGPGYFIVGDAAAVLDPSSSHGVLRGLMSGMQAAHEILRATKDHFSISTVMKDYILWFSQWFLRDVTKLKEFYLSHPDHLVW